MRDSGGALTRQIFRGENVSILLRLLLTAVFAYSLLLPVTHAQSNNEDTSASAEFGKIQDTKVCPFPSQACENGVWRLLSDSEVYAKLGDSTSFILTLPKGQVIHAYSGWFERDEDRIARHLWIQVDHTVGLPKGVKGWLRVKLNMLEAVPLAPSQVKIRLDQKRSFLTYLAITVLLIFGLIRVYFVLIPSLTSRQKVPDLINKTRLWVLLAVCVFMAIMPIFERNSSHFGWGFFPNMVSFPLTYMIPVLLLIDGFISVMRINQYSKNTMQKLWLIIASSAGLFALLILVNTNLTHLYASLAFWLTTLPFFAYVVFSSQTVLDKRLMLFLMYILVIASPWLGPFLTVPPLALLSLIYFFMVRSRLS